MAAVVRGIALVREHPFSLNRVSHIEFFRGSILWNSSRSKRVIAKVRGTYIQKRHVAYHCTSHVTIFFFFIGMVKKNLLSFYPKREKVAGIGVNGLFHRWGRQLKRSRQKKNLKKRKPFSLQTIELRPDPEVEVCLLRMGVCMHTLK